MTMEKDLEDVLKAGSDWKGSPEALWERVEERISTPQSTRTRWPWLAAGVAAAVVGISMLVMHQAPQPQGTIQLPATGMQQEPSGGRLGGVAQILATLHGTVADVQDGHLILNDPEYSHDQRDTRPAPQIPLPPGRWVTSTHWQSTDGNLNLFRGQPVTYFIDHQNVVPDVQFIHGVVQKVSGNLVDVALYDGDYGSPLTWKNQVGVQTYRVTARSALDGRALKPGDKVGVGWYGEPDYEVIGQVTFLN